MNITGKEEITHRLNGWKIFEKSNVTIALNILYPKIYIYIYPA